MISTRTVLISALGLALVAGLAFTALSEDPVPVDLAEVGPGSLILTVDAEGKTRVREVYDISAPITGTLLRLPLTVGDPVTGGQTVVAEVRPATAPLLDARSRAEAVAVLHEADAAVRFAEAEVARTGADEGFARANYDRTKALTEAGTASVTRLEDASLRLAQAEAAAVSAEARLAMAEASRERARAVLAEPEVNGSDGACCVRLVAPVDGLILSQSSASARPVAAGETLLSIGDPSDLEIVADLLSVDATRLRPGAAVTLDRWGGDAPLRGVLTRLEPTARTVVSALGVEEQRVDAIIDITSPREDWSGLGQGFSVFARIEEWRGDDALLIPLGAVFEEDGKWFTFLARDDGTVARTEIGIGRRDGRQAIVESGLSAGDRVVVHPPDTLADGKAIAERTRF